MHCFHSADEKPNEKSGTAIAEISQSLPATDSARTRKFVEYASYADATE